jgi:hypothetical protein
MSLTFERWYPLFFAVAATLLALLLDVGFPSGDSYRAGLLSAAISAAAIFVGFVATAKSILMALPPGGVRQRLHDSRYIDDLASYLNQAMVSNLVFCALNVAGFFPAIQTYIAWFTAAWIGVGTFCLFSFWRVGRLMMAILRLPPS